MNKVSILLLGFASTLAQRRRKATGSNEFAMEGGSGRIYRQRYCPVEKLDWATPKKEKKSKLCRDSGWDPSSDDDCSCGDEKETLEKIKKKLDCIGDDLKPPKV